MVANQRIRNYFDCFILEDSYENRNDTKLKTVSKLETK